MIYVDVIVNARRNSALYPLGRIMTKIAQTRRWRALAGLMIDRECRAEREFL